MKGPFGDLMLDLVTLAVAWLALSIVALRIGRRKGLGAIKCILGAFPLWAALFLLWIASKTDASVLQRLEQLEAGKR